MKKIAIICMIIGIVLLLGGVGCRLAVDLNKDVKEVNEGYECGMMIDGYNDIKELDIIEGYEMQEVERK